MTTSSAPRPVRRVAGISPRSATLSEIMHGYDHVATTDDAIIVTPKKLAEVPDLREIGHTGPSAWTGWLRREYNPNLRGNSGLRQYNEMRRSDGTIRGSLRLIKTPILSARWFIEPAADTDRDKRVADFVWWNLNEGMSTSFPQFLTEALLMLDYGYYAFEKVFRVNDSRPQARGKVTWQKLAPRHPMDVTAWVFDSAGGPRALRTLNAETNEEVEIPIEKLLVFTFDKEAGDMEGTSILRSAFKPWYYKQQLEKIDAIQKERHGIGVPIIKLPPNFSKADLDLAQNMGRNIRTNEMAHIVLPPNWEVLFAKLEGQPVDALKSIDYHNGEIHKNILASFLDRGGTMKDEDFSLFLKSIRYVADIVTDVINKFAIPQLVDFNWIRLPNGYPRLRARRIGEYADWRTQSFAIRNFIGAKVIRPDDRLEEQIRNEMDLPPVEEGTLRESQTPQMPPGVQNGQAPQVQPPGTPRIGPPRQNPRPPVQPPAPAAGGDRSGGR